MARTTKPLSDSACASAKPKEKEFQLFDGAGLSLLVKPNGSKIWRYRYNRPYGGKRNRMSLGHYPKVTLSDARDKRREFEQLLEKRVDPAEYLKEQAKATSQEQSLEAVARDWWAKAKKQWSEEHAKRILRRMEHDLFPKLGSLNIKEVIPHL